MQNWGGCMYDVYQALLPLIFAECVHLFYTGWYLHTFEKSTCTHSSPSIRTFPKVVIETIPVLVWLMMTRCCPFKAGHVKSSFNTSITCSVLLLFGYCRCCVDIVWDAFSWLDIISKHVFSVSRPGHPLGNDLHPGPHRQQHPR